MLGQLLIEIFWKRVRIAFRQETNLKARCDEQLASYFVWWLFTWWYPTKVLSRETTIKELSILMSQIM